MCKTHKYRAISPHTCTRILVYLRLNSHTHMGRESCKQWSMDHHFNVCAYIPHGSYWLLESIEAEWNLERECRQEKTYKPLICIAKGSY